MVHKLLAAGVCLALTVIAGCSDGGGDPSATPTATAPPRTGIASIDAAIDAVERQDADALLAQVRLSTFSCATASTARYGVGYCSGESNTFEAFPVAGCEDRYVSRHVAELLLSREVVPRASIAGLHAIFTTAGSRLDSSFFAPANASHVVVMESLAGDGETRGGLLIGDEGIVGYAAACGPSASRFSEYWELTDALFPLPTPTPRPTPPRTGVASIDAAVDAVRRGDADALIAQMRLSLIPCEAAPMGLSPFPTCDGEPDGTLFQRFPVSRCEAAYVSREGAAGFLREQFTSREAYVYAVYSAVGSQLEAGDDFTSDFYGRANPAYVVVVEKQVMDYVIADALLLDDAGVVGYSGGCGSLPEGLIAALELTDAIIPPPDER